MTKTMQLKRRIMIYTLVCIYSFALIRPITPIVNDAIAHVFFKMEHLATVHFENGKYHVHAELQKSAETTDSKGNTIASVFETLASHLKNDHLSFVIYRNTVYPITFTYINFPVDITLKSPTPPPKA